MWVRVIVLIGLLWPSLATAAEWDVSGEISMGGASGVVRQDGSVRIDTVDHLDPTGPATASQVERPRGGPWGPPSPPTPIPVPTDGSRPLLAIRNARGDSVEVVLGTDGRVQLRHARAGTLSGAIGSRPLAVGPNAAFRAVMNEAGDYVVTWQDHATIGAVAGDPSDLRVGTVRVSAGSHTAGTGYAIDLSRTGEAVLVWLQGVRGRGDIIRSYWHGTKGNWVGPRHVDGRRPQPVTLGPLRIDETGVATLVTWRRSDHAAPTTVRVHSAPWLGAWGRPVVLAARMRVLDAAVAVDGAGNRLTDVGHVAASGGARGVATGAHAARTSCVIRPPGGRAERPFGRGGGRLQSPHGVRHVDSGTTVVPARGPADQPPGPGRMRGDGFDERRRRRPDHLDGLTRRHLRRTGAGGRPRRRPDRRNQRAYRVPSHPVREAQPRRAGPRDGPSRHGAPRPRCLSRDPAVRGLDGRDPGSPAWRTTRRPGHDHRRDGSP